MKEPSFEALRRSGFTCEISLSQDGILCLYAVGCCKTGGDIQYQMTNKLVCKCISCTVGSRREVRPSGSWWSLRLPRQNKFKSAGNSASLSLSAPSLLYQRAASQSVKLCTSNGIKLYEMQPWVCVAFVGHRDRNNSSNSERPVHGEDASDCWMEAPLHCEPDGDWWCVFFVKQLLCV